MGQLLLFPNKISYVYHMIQSKLTLPGLLFFSLGFLVSCSQSYKKAGNGYEYSVIEQGNGKKLAYGKFVEFHLKQVYQNVGKDTVLVDSRDYMPRIESFDSTLLPPAYITALSNARIGDSIVLRIMTDSAYPEFKIPMPRHFRRGGYIYTTFKVLNIFDTRDEADSANLAQYKQNCLKIYQKNLAALEKKLSKDTAELGSESARIEEYLQKNNIRYQRGKWGTFVVIHEEGNGKKIEYNDVVAVDYIGKKFDTGEIFDSNLDPQFGHAETLEVTMAQVGNVLPGWIDALMELREGAKATIYIPSSLAYGKKGGRKRSRIKPNENLIFDITVKVVISEFRAMEIVSENRKKFEKKQDSLKKNNYLENIFPQLKPEDRD